MLGVDRPATHGAGVEPVATTRRRLVALTGLLGVLTVVHDVDHVRQGRWLPFVLYLVGVTDSYALANADALSWVSILAMMPSGLVLTIVAIQADS